MVLLSTSFQNLKFKDVGILFYILIISNDQVFLFQIETGKSTHLEHIKKVKYLKIYNFFFTRDFQKLFFLNNVAVLWNLYSIFEKTNYFFLD